MSTIYYQGIPVVIENKAGSVREGIDNNGKPWSTRMAHDYGEIKGTLGIDGDPVDCFIGPDKSAKFVYVVHQLKKDGSGFDEDKCFLGFSDVMEVKNAFFKNYDIGDHFWSGDVSTIPLAEFKAKVLATKNNPSMIRASNLETAIQLYAEAIPNPFSAGDQVLVDGLPGRGIVQKVNGRRVTVRYRDQMYVSRDYIFVHSIKDNIVSKMWRS